MEHSTPANKLSGACVGRVNPLSSYASILLATRQDGTRRRNFLGGGGRSLGSACSSLRYQNKRRWSSVARQLRPVGLQSFDRSQRSRVAGPLINLGSELKRVGQRLPKSGARSCEVRGIGRSTGARPSLDCNSIRSVKTSAWRRNSSAIIGG